jgi:hypothetical protein
MCNFAVFLFLSAVRARPAIPDELTDRSVLDQRVSALSPTNEPCASVLVCLLACACMCARVCEELDCIVYKC